MDTETIHEKEFVDKELPTIVFKNEKHDGFNISEFVAISVSDKTSKDALETFKRVRSEIK